MGVMYGPVDKNYSYTNDPSEVARVIKKSGDLAVNTEMYASPLSKLCEQEEEESSTSFMAEALTKLPAQHQTVLKLRFFSELSYNQIAEKTGLSLGNVGFILNDAKVKLNQLCRKHYETTHGRKSKDRYKFKRGSKPRATDSIQPPNKRRSRGESVRKKGVCS